MLTLVLDDIYLIFDHISLFNVVPNHTIHPANTTIVNTVNAMVLNPLRSLYNP